MQEFEDWWAKYYDTPNERNIDQIIRDKQIAKAAWNAAFAAIRKAKDEALEEE